MAENDQKRDSRPETRRDGDEEDAIARNLKRAYDKVANEPLPDTLASLLERLKKDG